MPDKKEQKSKKLPEKTTQTRKSNAGKAAEHDMFPIVAIGASAGGLEALQQFFNNMPPNSGMAFVVITHLDPNHASRMAELLQKNTEMRVFEAQDNAKIQPDTVYVIPPHRNILVMNHTLQLLEQPLSPGLSHTIDIFFRSLSEDLKDRAICIVLSGTGTDGTSGLRAVKAELGMAIAQDPGSAAYQGMPSSAIETGLVDYVLSPAEMPARLIEYIRDFYGKPAAMRRDAVERVPGALQKIFVLMRSQFRVDFSAYKEATLRRRLDRRMALHQLTDLRQYLRLLQESPEELSTLYKDFLINVTNFFRDADAFISLKAKLNLLIQEKPEGSTFRAWMVGCSSGEEAYSVSMLIRECIDEQKRNLQMQVFGTDIDQDAINTARTGIYPQNIISDITSERLSQFFISKENTYQVKKDVREAIIFSYQNALKDPPFSKIDLLVCRNLLIYLKPDVQRKLLALFHYALNPGGILFLGTSETVSDFGEQYAPLDRKWRIYNRRPVSLSNWVASDVPMVFTGATDVGAQIAEGKRAEKQSISDLAEKLLSSVYVPSAVVVNRN
ncbi:MAG: chemotaxis protein CheB, partial [Dehalococcoidia bacterium]|nr:chemotaxis protein CheB [Dehalococcoidia bacterium]